MDGHLPSLGWLPTILGMVTHQPKNGHPLTFGWSSTRRKCSTDLEFGTYTLLSKLTPGDNCHGWSPTIPRRVTRQPKDDQPPKGSVLQTWNLALRFNSQNERQIKTSMDGHLPSRVRMIQLKPILTDTDSNRFWNF